MDPRWPTVTLILSFSLVGSALAQGGSEDPVEGVVEVVPVPVEPDNVTLERYPVLDGSLKPAGSKQWRIVDGTGNCCEHYLASTPQGRLLDFGGTYLVFTDDLGTSWRQVPTPAPVSGGEGAVSAAPGGDVVALGWTPYMGDQAWAHKYDATDGTWSYAPVPLHKPLYDRPWITAIPGPVELAGQAATYATAISGGGDGDLMLSTDGLTYLTPTSELTAYASGPTSFPATVDPDRDWVQPHQEAELYPMGAGRALSTRELHLCPAYTVLEPSLSWSCTNAKLPDGAFVMDALGTIHNVQADSGAKTIRYRVSHDSGATWQVVRNPLPWPGEIEDLDFKTSAAADMTVVAVHAHKGETDTDQDLVYRYRGISCAPRLDEVLSVGKGNHDLSSGLFAEKDRFDFSSVALLPGGRVAVSFADADHTAGPGLAIELGDPPAGTTEPLLTPDNCVPLPSFTRSITEPFVGEEILFDASASEDLDGEITRYTWDFGDDSEPSKGVQARHLYEKPGVYNVTLEVVDDEDRRATKTQPVQVLDALSPASSDANLRPVARFDVEPTGWTVRVDATASRDMDGSIVAYEWDWGDGTHGVGTHASHTYEAAGNYTLALTVTDDVGAQGSNTVTVTLTGSALQDAGESKAGEDANGATVPGPGLLGLLAALAAAGTAVRRKPRG